MSVSNTFPERLRAAGPRLWRGLNYGLPALLLLVLLVKLFGAALFGEPPRPQIPPHGYLAYEKQVTLYWSRGRHEGDFHVQVSADGDFSQPVVERSVSGEKLILPPLEPGREYCWRVLDESDALVTCFRTNHAITPH